MKGNELNNIVTRIVNKTKILVIFYGYFVFHEVVFSITLGYNIYIEIQ